MWLLVSVLYALVATAFGQDPQQSTGSVFQETTDTPTLNGNVTEAVLIKGVAADWLSMTPETTERKGVVPRKGIEKEPSKARKGVLSINETADLTPATTEAIPQTKSKPSLAIDDSVTEEDQGAASNYNLPLVTVGLSLGVVAILLLVSVSYWRLREIWSRWQYKRVDFLVDGMYADS